MVDSGGETLSVRARRYASVKYALAIVDIAYLAVLLFIFLVSGLSVALKGWLLSLKVISYFILPLYLFFLSALYYLLSFPLNFYRSFILEHRFSLTRQKLGNWFIDQLKTWMISYIISIILAGAFYYILRHNQRSWWLMVSFFWIFFTLFLARLTPTVIIPLFFKYKRLSDDALRERIMHLAEKMQVRLLDCFEIDFSSKTLKANAAFVGWGRARRVILADTLKDKYTHDEIEVILAHEFAHYKMGHLFKLISINSLFTLITFYIIFRTSDYFLGLSGFYSLQDIAAMPLVFLYFLISGIIMQPVENFISRIFERNADSAALKVTGLKGSFVSMMEKLAEQNLSHRNPHPLIKFFFFDHPPINERIKLAQ